MNKEDLKTARKELLQKDEDKLMNALHSNYRKANIGYQISIQKNKLERIKKQEKMIRNNLIKNVAIVSLCIVAIIGLFYVNHRLDDDFMENCTQHTSEAVCRKGM